MSLFLSGYNQRIQLTIDHTKVSSTLTNFPVLVKLSSSSGQTARKMTNIFTTLQSDANRRKIMVMMADNVTQCYVEIQSWSTSGQTAYLWVNIPSISSTVDTVFYIYYSLNMADNTAYVNDTGGGAAKLVWDSNYQVVSHLEQDPSGTAPQETDSTSNVNHGTAHGSMTSGELVSAIVQNGLSFNGSNQYIDVGNCFYSETLSVECIVKFNAVSPASRMNIIVKNNSSHEWDLYLNSSNKLVLAVTNSSGTGVGITGSTTITTGVWYHIVGTIGGNGTTMSLYVNGVLDASGSQTNACWNSTWHITLGWDQSNTSGRALNGILDEVRISNVVRPAAYVTANYNSKKDSLITYSLQFTGCFYGSNDIFDVFKTLYLSNLIANTMLDFYAKNVIAEGADLYLKNPMTEDYEIYFANELAAQKTMSLFYRNIISQGFNKDLFCGNKLEPFSVLSQFYFRHVLGDLPTIPLAAMPYKTYVQNINDNPNYYIDLPSSAPSYIYDITIDGIDVTHLITSVKITVNDTDFTNHLELSFINLDMYNQCDPYSAYGQERVFITIIDISRGETTVWKFLIEQRDRSEQFGSYKFTLSGRQKTILLGAGYALPADNIDENKMASGIAAILAGNYVSVNWTAMDYFIPDFTYLGFPIDGIKLLAEGTGAILRTNHDGTLVIRRRLVVRPQNLLSQPVDFVFSDSQILKREVTEEKATFNAIEVISTGDQDDALDIAVVDNCIRVGEEGEVWIYIGRNDNYNVYMSEDGVAQKVSSKNLQNLQEIIEVKGGKGSVSRRIFGINNYVFNPTPDSNLNGAKLNSYLCPDGLHYPFKWVTGRSDITFDSTVNPPFTAPIVEGILTINYYTLYDIWHVKNDVTGKSLFIAELPGVGINLIVTLGAGNYLNAPITHPFIATQGQAVAVAQASLDETANKKYIYKITIPYCNASDGQIAVVNGMKGYIRQADISLGLKNDAPVLTQDLVIEVYLDPSTQGANKGIGWMVGS